MTNCPCGSNKLYLDCCGAFITGKAIPATPEELMRSRYTAYSKANIDYIIKTMKGPAAKDYNKKEAEQWAKTVLWLGLEVLGSRLEDKRGWVEFIAHYSFAGKKEQIHELSEFHQEGGYWYYVDGELYR